MFLSRQDVDLEEDSFGIRATKGFGFCDPIIMGKFILSLFGREKGEEAVEGIETDSFAFGYFYSAFPTYIEGIADFMSCSTTLLDPHDFDF